MGSACCGVKALKCEYFIPRDDGRGKIINLKCKTSQSYSNSNYNYDKIKDDDRCSILVNSLGKDTNYIVSYKESQERRIIEKKFKNFKK